MKIRKSASFNLFSVLTLLAVLPGCATIFSGTSEYIRISSQEPALDGNVRAVALTDKGRAPRTMVLGETIDVQRTMAPITVNIQESDCILPSTESIKSHMNPVALLDFLATSLLSTSIDSSTGALWKYGDVSLVNPKVRDTPECQEWLQELRVRYQESHKSPEAPAKADNSAASEDPAKAS
ncbi:hypothetical protein [Succinimonas amylolytica]|uniref:hypothetical protein n=1 Tax=Succinimonas amylolytica TaxID=83769 RepID=UPI00036A0928|nr:hypothetical protein [Succinimonas amylolytica]